MIEEVSAYLRAGIIGFKHQGKFRVLETLGDVREIQSATVYNAAYVLLQLRRTFET